MIRNIKRNNLLKKYQDGENITTPTVSPNAIAFTSGFETNRGYANNGYTSSTEPRNMSNDYAYILADLPEPLQVILLDAVHNQSNLPGTMILALAKNNPVLYQKLAGELSDGFSNAMQAAMILRDRIGTTKAYEGKDTQLGLWIETIKPDILKAYNENPKKFIDDFTKSRIERNSSFGNKNTSVIQGSNNKMEEWAERSVAAAEYAKDLIDGDAETPDYYYDVNKNQNVFKQQIKPIVDFTSTNIFPGDGTEDSKEWYNKVDNLYNTETKTIQDTQKNISKIDEVDEVDNTKTTESPKNINTKPEKNVIVNTKYPLQYTPLDKNFGVDKQDVYTDNMGDKHYIFEDNTKWEVDIAGDKIKGTNEILTPEDKKEFIGQGFQLAKSDDESVDQKLTKQPNVLKTVGNVLNKGIEKIDKSLRDKNPYRDDTYGPIKDKNKELREERKAERQKNQAVRKTRIENIKQDNILKKINEKKDKREIINARREKAEKKSKDKLEAAKEIGDEKTEKAIVGIKSRGEIQAKKREDKARFRKRKAELNLLNAEIKQLEKQQKQHWNRKKKEEKNVTGKKGYEKTKQDLENYKKFLEDDARYEFVPPKKHGGKLKYKTGGNLIKYQNSGTIIPGVSKEWWDYMSNQQEAERPIYPGIGDWTGTGIVTDMYGKPYKLKKEKKEKKEKKKDYDQYDPYSLMRPSHKISDAANWGVTGYNLALASQAPEKTPLFRTDYTPLRQYAPVDFMPATKQYAIGKRAIAQNARGTGTLMGNLQQLNSNILNKKIDIAKRAADSQLGFDRTYETAKEKIAKEFRDEKRHQYFKDLEHRSAKQNALTEAVSKWNKQQQTRAKYIQAENSDVNKIRTYVNQLSADYNVRLDKDGMAHVIHNKTGKKDREKTNELNGQRRLNLTNEINQVMELMKNEKDENKIIQYRQRIDTLYRQLDKVGFYTGANYAPKVEDAVTNSSKIETSNNKRGGNIKSKKTTNVLMDGGYTPRNKRQKKLRTKLY
jgi:hypothetical protein